MSSGESWPEAFSEAAGGERKVGYWLTPRWLGLQLSQPEARASSSAIPKAIQPGAHLFLHPHFPLLISISP